MTAAVVALGAGGSVTSSGAVSVFGLDGAEAATAVEITPLGVGLTGALLLSRFFLRSLRPAGVGVTAADTRRAGGGGDRPVRGGAGRGDAGRARRRRARRGALGLGDLPASTCTALSPSSGPCTPARATASAARLPRRRPAPPPRPPRHGP